jgi:hypothetical protein
MVDSQDLLQHPRRNLGNRYRSSAQKFANLAQKDPDRARENYAWAEQNARQAILHDFTDERNWRCLAELKVANNDGEGLHAVMEDVFSILGRDPEHLDQLKGIDFLAVGRELLEAAFSHWIPILGGPSLQRVKINKKVPRRFQLLYRNSRNVVSDLILETKEPILYLVGDWSVFVIPAMKICSLNLPDIYLPTDPITTNFGWKWGGYTNGEKKLMMHGLVMTTFNNYGRILKCATSSSPD